MARKDFVHPVINREITSISGMYMYQQEVRVPFGRRELLYLTGYYIVDRSCCGTGGCVFAAVPGFIEKWHYRHTDDGSPVSSVESIDDPETRAQVISLIRRKEISQQFNFL